MGSGRADVEKGARERRGLIIDGWQHMTVEQGSREWARMWSAFGGLSANGSTPCAECCPCCEECWQYMGTRIRIAEPERPEWKMLPEFQSCHEFRHRHHPRTGKRAYVHVAPTERFLNHDAFYSVNPEQNEPVAH